MNDENLSKWMKESWKRWAVFSETWKVKFIYFKDFSRTTYNSRTQGIQEIQEPLTTLL